MPPTTEPAKDPATKPNWMDIAFKLMSMLVIPLVLWGARLETSQATQDLKIQQLEADIKSVKEDLKTTKEQAVSIAVLTEQMKTVSETLKEIKVILNAKWPQR